MVPSPPPLPRMKAPVGAGPYLRAERLKATTELEAEAVSSQAASVQSVLVALLLWFLHLRLMAMRPLTAAVVRRPTGEWSDGC